MRLSRSTSIAITPSGPCAKMLANFTSQRTSSHTYELRVETPRREGLFERADEDEKLRLRGGKTLGRHAGERTVGGDRMDDRPMQREEFHRASLERELVEVALANAVDRLRTT